MMLQVIFLQTNPLFLRSGGRDLSSSQSYPVLFGQTIAKFHQESALETWTAKLDIYIYIYYTFLLPRNV